MAVVRKAMARAPSWRQWQNRIESVQGLNGALFVDPKYRRMLGRLYLQPNKVGGLGLEGGVVGGQVAFAPMGPNRLRKKPE